MMRLRTRGIATLILGVFWGIIALGMVSGYWQTKIAAEEAVAKSPEEIKGWMTLKDVSKDFKIPVDELAKRAGLPVNVETDKPLKDLAKENDKDTEYYRDVIRTYLDSGKK